MRTCRSSSCFDVCCSFSWEPTRGCSLQESVPAVKFHSIVGLVLLAKPRTTGNIDALDIVRGRMQKLPCGLDVQFATHCSNVGVLGENFGQL